MIPADGSLTALTAGLRLRMRRPEGGSSLACNETVLLPHCGPRTFETGLRCCGLLGFTDIGGVGSEESIGCGRPKGFETRVIVINERNAPGRIVPSVYFPIFSESERTSVPVFKIGDTRRCKSRTVFASLYANCGVIGVRVLTLVCEISCVEFNVLTHRIFLPGEYVAYNNGNIKYESSLFKIEIYVSREN